MKIKTGEVKMIDVKPPDLQHACIYLQKPFAGCYCMNISSFNISKMLAFCTGDFRSCPMFCRAIEENETPVEAGSSVRTARRA